MLKLFGIVLLIGSTTTVGIRMSAELSKRVSQLELVLRLLERFQTCLRYEQTPTLDLIGGMSKLPLFAPLPFLTDCIRRMEGGEPFPHAWANSLSACKGSHLAQDDLDVLAGLAQIIGSSDAAGQISAIDVVNSQLTQNLEEARSRRDAYGKLYRSLGVLSGVGAAIFFL